MYKRILVPVDGSDLSIKAGHEAVKFAKSIGATVVVTHIIDQKSPRSYNELEDEAYSYINNVRDYATECGVESEDVLIFGSPKNDIMIIARKTMADMIIMGTHGNTGITSTILGSFSQFVLKNIDLPILFIK